MKANGYRLRNPPCLLEIQLMCVGYMVAATPFGGGGCGIPFLPLPGINPRVAISEEVIAAIDRLVQENRNADEGVFLCGDMNDGSHPTRVFTTRGSFIDTQAALLLAPIDTQPCRPSSKREDFKMSRRFSKEDTNKTPICSLKIGRASCRERVCQYV